MPSFRKSTHLAVAITALSAFAPICLPAARAVPISVTDQVTGSAGNWTLTFTITDNMPIAQNLYFFGVALPAVTSDSITAAPAGWNYDGQYNWSASGGSNTTYYNSFYNGDGITPGTSLSGFSILDTELSAPTQFSWFGYTFGAVAYTGGDNFNTSTTNPGFEVDNASTGIVPAPEPASLALLGTGLAAIGVMRRRRHGN